MHLEDTMTSRAQVCAVHEDGSIDVKILSAPRCRGCEGACTWFRAADSSLLRLRYSADVTVGEIVQVSLPAREILFGAILLHGLPWVMLLLGGSLGAWLGGDDLSCLFGAILGLCAALGATAQWHRRLEMETINEMCISAVR
jgi:positive regulator of sigma E activity